MADQTITTQTQTTTQDGQHDEPEKKQTFSRPVFPRVVVAGAGFGGLNVARGLAGSEVDVTVLDRNNYHGFWPLLYQVATAGLEPESIAYPVRAILRDYRNVSFQVAEVSRIDLEKRTVFTDGLPLQYDYLVIAAGSANNYFGNDSLAD